MKKLITILIPLLSLLDFNSYAQETTPVEKYGNTLNLGLGIGGYAGYYGYAGYSLPVLHIDYELDVLKNFTLAPFLNFATLSNEYYWGNNTTPYRYYTYTETTIPIGVKGTYYFDDLLKAGPQWDFYLAGSLGFAIVTQTWEVGYEGNVNYYPAASSLFLDIHIGTEYHITNKLGVFLDLSSGVSTIGLAIHR